ncbi:hypothetical protein EON82_25820, partial [bacterium]
MTEIALSYTSTGLPEHIKEIIEVSDYLLELGKIQDEINQKLRDLGLAGKRMGQDIGSAARNIEKTSSAAS